MRKPRFSEEHIIAILRRGGLVVSGRVPPARRPRR